MVLNASHKEAPPKDEDYVDGLHLSLAPCQAELPILSLQPRLFPACFTIGQVKH